MNMKSDSDRSMTDLEAAHHLGVTLGLLFQFTKKTFGGTSNIRSLKVIGDKENPCFSLAELEDFNSQLKAPWCEPEENRISVPKSIVEHLRVESGNQCARCGSGIGLQNAHIKPWNETRSNHPHNLICLCSKCHNEHDVHNSFSTTDLEKIKQKLIAQTRSHLMAKMHPSNLKMPRPSTKFVGREKEIEKLKEGLHSQDPIVISGAGGIGKTELLLQALSKFEDRPIFWCNIEKFRTVTEVISELCTAMSASGVACGNTELPSQLDKHRACVVFDGIEQSDLDNMSEFENVVRKLFDETRNTLFISTTQALLHRLPGELKIKLGILENPKCDILLNELIDSDYVINKDSVSDLLNFCDGHALTIKLAASIVTHYGSIPTALKAINKSSTAVNMPEQKTYTRGTALELCLRTAYKALREESQQLLWGLAIAPAGIYTHVIENGWLPIDDPDDALAMLRRWHLVETEIINDSLSRTRVLSPIRQFAINRGLEDNRSSFEDTASMVVKGFVIYSAILDSNYEDKSHPIMRFNNELPNLLYTFEIARNKVQTKQIIEDVLMIPDYLMRYFFITRQLELGSSVMLEAIQLALDYDLISEASELSIQFFNLSYRSLKTPSNEQMQQLLAQILTKSDDAEVIVNISICKAIAADGTGDHIAAEKHSREVISEYGRLFNAENGRAISGNENIDGNQYQNNIIAIVLTILGRSLYFQEKYIDAISAYRKSMEHTSARSLDVNLGQILYEIGRCEDKLNNHRKAVGMYYDAAVLFNSIGMKKYLSDAGGNLGYTLLNTNINESGFILGLDEDFVKNLLQDIQEDILYTIEVTRLLDDSRSLWVVQKLTGIIYLLSFTNYGNTLGEFCSYFQREIQNLKVDYSSYVGNYSSNIMYFETLLMAILDLGILINKCEQEKGGEGDVQDVTIDQIIDLIDDLPESAEDILGLSRWLSVYLTQRLEYKG